MKTHSPLWQQILQILHQKHLLTVPALLEELNQRSIHVNKTSVYRALETLLKKKLVVRNSFGENEIFYECTEDHHDHLVCTSCGRVEATACTIKLSSIPNFTVESHQVTLYGKCQNCTAL